jgi:hypothetical protein
MAKSRRQQVDPKQPELFPVQPPQPAKRQPPPKKPQQGTLQHALARADQAETPVAALRLGPHLERLARLCKTLADDAAGDDFELGVIAAGAVVGGDSYAGSYAMQALEAAGLVVLVRRGSPGHGCSVWRWCGDRPAGLPYWNDQAALVAAGTN